MSTRRSGFWAESVRIRISRSGAGGSPLRHGEGLGVRELPLAASSGSRGRREMVRFRAAHTKDRGFQDNDETNGQHGEGLGVRELPLAASSSNAL